MLTAQEAWDALQHGNRRFCEGRGGECLSAVSQQQREGLLDGQKPIAMVVGCADSRVPPELVFDQGPGQLFTVRVAGQVLASPQVASLEFAATAFQTRLIVVLGHSCCGAVRATLAAMDQAAAPQSPHLEHLIKAIRIPLSDLDQSRRLAPGERENHAIAANARWVAQSILAESPVLCSLAESDGLLVKSAVYDLSTGVVKDLDAENL